MNSNDVHTILAAGGIISGMCAICWQSGQFSAEDCFFIADFEFWAHPKCRQDWEKMHDLEEWVFFQGGSDAW